MGNTRRKEGEDISVRLSKEKKRKEKQRSGVEYGSQAVKSSEYHQRRERVQPWRVLNNKKVLEEKKRNDEGDTRAQTESLFCPKQNKNTRSKTEGSASASEDVSGGPGDCLPKMGAFDRKKKGARGWV